MTPDWILIVDDDEDARLSLAELLEDEGYAVRAVAEAEQALEILRTSRPRLVLADLMMPGINGQKLFELARSFLDVVPPFVFVTATPPHLLGDVDTVVLKKPFDLDALLEIVARHCRPHQKAT